MHGQDRIEEMRQPDAMRLRHEAKQGAVPVEAPGAARLGHRQARLVVPIKQHVAGAPHGVLVGQLERLGAEPLDIDDRHEAIGEDAADGCVRLEVFELCGVGQAVL